MTCHSSYNLIPYAGPTTVGFENYQHPYYYSDFESESSHYGHQHDSHVSNVQRRLTDERLQCDRNLGWSIDWATAYLVDHLDPSSSPDVADTLRQLSIRCSQLAQEGNWKQIAFRAFNPLAQTLFNNHLKDAVYLGFGRLSHDVSGATYAHGQGPNRRVRRISIILNSAVLQNAPGAHILSALIHQMIHAYFLVACGPQDDKTVAYGRLDHGPPFLKLLKTIQDLSRSRGRLWIPGLSFGNKPSYMRRDSYEFDPYDYYARPRRTQKSDPTKEWYRSHCSPPEQSPHPADVEKYFNEICKPLYDLPESLRGSRVLIFNKHHELEEVPRAEAPSSSSSVEFIYNGKGVLVPGEKLNAFISVKRAFEAGGRYYDLENKDISRDGFYALLELVHTGSFSPDPAQVLSRGAGGPPVIRPVRQASPTYLLRSVAVFKTGLELGFEDLLGVALGRMRKIATTHEDPVRVLEAVYSGNRGDPHPDLRQWVRDFLCAPMGARMEWGRGRGVMGMEESNLEKLKRELCFAERFAELCEGFGALVVDVLKVEEVLMGLGGLGTLSRFGSPVPALGLRGRGRGRYESPQVNIIGANLGMGMGMSGAPLASTLASRGLGLGVGWRDDAVAREEMELEYEREMERERREFERLERLGMGGLDRGYEEWGY